MSNRQEYSLRRRIVCRAIPIQRSYHGLEQSRQKMWNITYRWLVSTNERWFFEGNRKIPGQLWSADREVIYSAVRELNPQTVFEVGTWKGGGSTYFIASALRDNGGGLLHTIELERSLHQEAVDNYQRYAPDLLRHVQFHQGSSTDIYPEILSKSGADIVFLDGIGAEQTLAEFRLFERYFKRGGVLIAHDWNDDKTRLLRPYIEDLPGWKNLAVIVEPKSVGLAVYRFEGTRKD